MSSQITKPVLYRGDCVKVMAALPPGSVDAIVTDPPYGLEFMGKEWDRLDGGFSKPGIGDRKTAWPSFGGDEFAGYNPTCEMCGGRLRGKNKCRGRFVRLASRQAPAARRGSSTAPKHHGPNAEKATTIQPSSLSR